MEGIAPCWGSLDYFAYELGRKGGIWPSVRGLPSCLPVILNRTHSVKDHYTIWLLRDRASTDDKELSDLNGTASDQICQWLARSSMSQTSGPRVTRSL